jgi:hypothetical protein
LFRAYVIFVVNVPGWFSWLWGLIKPLVHPVINLCHLVIYWILVHTFPSVEYPKKGENTLKEASSGRFAGVY